MSLINVLFDTPMVQILAQISVSDEIKKALINRTGRYGDMLQLVIDLECMSNDDPMPNLKIDNIDIALDDLRTMQCQAFEFSNVVTLDAG